MGFNAVDIVMGKFDSVINIIWIPHGTRLRDNSER